MSAYLCDFATFDALAEYGTRWNVTVPTDTIRPDLLDEFYAQHPEAFQSSERLRFSLRGLSRQRVGSILWAENLRSVAYRYPDTARNRANLPGQTDEVCRDYRFRPVGDVDLPKSWLSMAIACLEYQSCETPDWKQTVARAILLALKDAIVRLLPGYGSFAATFAGSDAPWGLTDEHVHPPRRGVRGEDKEATL